MRPLSATEAISPAIEHTRALLQPFSLKLWLKLGLSQVSPKPEHNSSSLPLETTLILLLHPG